MIKDSGQRTEFETGAVRDMHENKGDMASIPWESILRLARHYENGAKKYNRWNFRKGIPISSFILLADTLPNTNVDAMTKTIWRRRLSMCLAQC